MPAASVDARETMMCAPPEAGTHVVALQSPEVWRGSTTVSSVGFTKAGLAEASERRATIVFILGKEGGGWVGE